MHAILRSFTYPLKPFTQAPISTQPISILHATHNHVLPYPCVHPFNHTTKPISLSKPSPTCGILPKKLPRGSLSFGHADGPSRHVASLIPPGWLTSGILLRRRSIRMSHTQNPSPLPFHLGVSHPEFYPADVPPSSDISHPESCLPTFHLPRISRIRNPVRRRSTLFSILGSIFLRFPRSHFQ